MSDTPSLIWFAEEVLGLDLEKRLNELQALMTRSIFLVLYSGNNRYTIISTETTEEATSGADA